MAENFEKVNKQIATFIVVSAALTAPVALQTQYTAAQANLPGMEVVQQEPMICRYAGPIMPPAPQPQPQPMPVPEPVRYAGPIIQHPEMPIPEPVRYAGPVGLNTDAALNMNNSGVQNNPTFNQNMGNMQTIGSGHFIFK